MQTVARVLNKAGSRVQGAGRASIDLSTHAYETQPCNYVRSPGGHTVCSDTTAASVYFRVLVWLLMAAGVFLPIDGGE